MVHFVIFNLSTVVYVLHTCLRMCLCVWYWKCVCLYGSLFLDTITTKTTTNTTTTTTHIFTTFLTIWSHLLGTHFQLLLLSLQSWHYQHYYYTYNHYHYYHRYQHTYCHHHYNEIVPLSTLNHSILVPASYLPLPSTIHILLHRSRLDNSHSTHITSTTRRSPSPSPLACDLYFFLDVLLPPSFTSTYPFSLFSYSYLFFLLASLTRTLRSQPAVSRSSSSPFSSSLHHRPSFPLFLPRTQPRPSPPQSLYNFLDFLFVPSLSSQFILLIWFLLFHYFSLLPLILPLRFFLQVTYSF